MRRHSPLKKTLQVLGVLLLIALPLAFAYFYPQLGPRSVPDKAAEKYEDMSVADLLRQSMALEEEFDAVIAIREPTEAEVAQLKEALDLQVAYLKRSPTGDREFYSRRDALRAKLHDYASRPVEQTLLEVETEARELQNLGQMDAALEKFREALALQREINQRLSQSPLANPARQNRLERTVRYLEAEPLYQRSLSLEREADAAAESGNWERARTLMADARLIQEQLNRDYRGASQASPVRLGQLRAKLTDYEAGLSLSFINERVEAAQNAESNGNYLEAADHYSDAMRRQQVLNEQFPDSRFSSPQRVGELDGLRQTALSFRLASQIRASTTRLEQLLRDRDTGNARELLQELNANLAEFNDAFPQSQADLGDAPLRARYLSFLGENLDDVQERIYADLVPLPGQAGARMFRTEVPHRLYRVVMGSNPSPVSGETLPVPPIRYANASEFCQRLTWVLGRPVRLPSEADFKAALGNLRYIKLEAVTWNSENSEGAPQPIGTREPTAGGFVDLLGNVAEWLQAPDAGDAYPVAGGDATDSLEALYRVPIEMRDSPRGADWIGLRFLVESVATSSD